MKYFTFPAGVSEGTGDTPHGRCGRKKCDPADLDAVVDSICGSGGYPCGCMRIRGRKCVCLYYHGVLHDPFVFCTGPDVEKNHDLPDAYGSL